ncbi:bacillithiol system redox-active protein YtxJ [Paenibacillus humicola]|uniref:bacillithiol system redox-active protein YtxJ n=1 Tax=Paenibacillus humicola TaxID=3110540 RepID=UPI00237A0C04|nr:bacillithiol system redox-active protein YtxJ [Paenibacillus humicola]
MKQYREIESLADWESAYSESANKQLVIFKHSTTCPVSANALNEFNAYLQENPAADTDYVLVKVIESRPVSNKIAEDTAVKHESPQIILIKNKEKVWSASHWSITTEHMTAVLN